HASVNLVADSVGSGSSGLYIGSASSRRSSSSVLAPAPCAPSRAIRNAARLVDDRASEPPRPTMVSATALSLLSGSYPRESIRRERPMEDAQINENIERLVAEEHEMWQRESAGDVGEDERRRLQDLQDSLDQCWDLLRQRRA